jgi:hypothetical protein
MNFRGCREKTRPETRPETRRRPVVLPLRGAEVLVDVRGPSPGEGGREKDVRKHTSLGTWLLDLWSHRTVRALPTTSEKSALPLSSLLCFSFVWPMFLFFYARAQRGIRKKKLLPSGRKLSEILVWTPQAQKLQIPHQTPGKASRW